MAAVTIHIATQSKFVKLFVWLIRLCKAEYSIETVGTKTLRSVIEQGEKDFAEGKGKVMTIEELRSMANEVA
ncbi:MULTISPECIES: hypothetical protein [Larkinella]|uniref:Uncharacterized protein n=1 Tax=Larkinella humicola TaxID=2607654 RepID=A0A5N1JKA1_9BACT|nr:MULTISPECIES: hypothetical protein [Larkinella]KAA9356890.1 hypothetical protein F0P93_03880 [Larkinella humicola]